MNSAYALAGTGAGGILENSSGLTDEIENELETGVPALDTMMKEGLDQLSSGGGGAGEWTKEEFIQILKDYDYQLHRVFPEDFQEWFEDMGIDIDDYTLPLDQPVDSYIHAANGGNWNGAWEEWFVNNVLPNDLNAYDAAQFATSMFAKLNIPFDPNNLMRYIK